MAIRLISEPRASITERHFEEAANAAYKILDRLPKDLFYHRKAHTVQHVVPATLNLAKLEKLPAGERWLAGIAAAFHDVGFVSQYNANELYGASYAVDHMMLETKLPYIVEQLLIVKNAILNTDMKKDPSTRVAKVLRDADLSVIGHPDFLVWNDDLRKEVLLHPESSMYKSAQDETWQSTQLKFIETFQRWFTRAAESLYAEQKAKNIEAFKAKYK